MIGQPAERDATVAALRRAMPFVRHELGTRLRIRRIPDLHVHLDDTAERGTRVLQLLSELEAGRTPGGDAPLGESLPTPVARLPQPGDLPEEPPSAGSDAPSRPTAESVGRSAAGTARVDRSASRRPPDRRDERSTWVHILSAVPDARRRTHRAARAASLRSATRTPTRTRSVPRSASSSWSRRSAARPIRSARTRCPAIYDFMPGVERVRTDPDPDVAYDLLVILDCGSLDRVGDVGRAPRRAVRAAPAGDHRPPCLQRRRGRGRLDRSGGRRDVRDGRPAGRATRRATRRPTAARSRPT